MHTTIMLIIIFLLLGALIYSCVRIARCKDQRDAWKRDYFALDQGMIELGESMQADILDYQERNNNLNEVNDFLSEDRILLYKMASRCHTTCLPGIHGFSDEELELLARMQDRYGPYDEMEPLQDA